MPRNDTSTIALVSPATGELPEITSQMMKQPRKLESRSTSVGALNDSGTAQKSQSSGDVGTVGPKEAIRSPEPPRETPKEGISEPIGSE